MFYKYCSKVLIFILIQNFSLFRIKLKTKCHIYFDIFPQKSGIFHLITHKFLLQGVVGRHLPRK